MPGHQIVLRHRCFVRTMPCHDDQHIKLDPARNDMAIQGMTELTPSTNEKLFMAY
jgi:hypothetical protein